MKRKIYYDGWSCYEVAASRVINEGYDHTLGFYFVETEHKCFYYSHFFDIFFTPFV